MHELVACLSRANQATGGTGFILLLLMLAAVCRCFILLLFLCLNMGWRACVHRHQVRPGIQKYSHTTEWL